MWFNVATQSKKPPNSLDIDEHDVFDVGISSKVNHGKLHLGKVLPETPPRPRFRIEGRVPIENVTEWRDKKGVLRKKGTGYKGLTPHMLRHTQATLLIGNNTDIKTVQARLGHSSVNLTLDIYSHAIAANDRAASDAFSKLIAPKPEDV